MAALIPTTGFRVAKRQTACATSVAIHACHYSDSPRILKNDNPAEFRRGTGGRSSFNGIICTVFGNTGFVGRSLCNKLGRIGTQMILPYRGDHYESMRLKATGDLGQVLFHPYELYDEVSIRKCIKYSNVVINLVGCDWETKNFSYKDVHVDGARRLARLAKEAGVEQFIHVSALNANLHPETIVKKGGSQFFKSKAEGEIAVKEEFPEATIIRPSDIYGQEDRFLQYYAHSKRITSRSIPLWKNGESVEKQPIAVSDVATGIAAVITNPDTIGKTYQFVGPKRYLLSDLVDWMYALMGMDKDSGYSRCDLRYALHFQARVYMNKFISIQNRQCYLHWEGIEKEHTSDKLLRSLPTLEDLGVTPINMEDQVPWELIPSHIHCYYTPEIGEIIDPEPPKTIPIRYADE